MSGRWGRLARHAAAACCLGAALSGFANERILYRSVLADGRVVYADEPVPNARRSDRIAVERHEPNPADAAAAQRATAMTRAQLLRDAAVRAARLRQLDNLIGDTYDELKAVELQREQGREVGEGDRQGRRFSAGYLQRQQALDNAVVRVRQRLNALTSERSALQY